MTPEILIAIAQLCLATGSRPTSYQPQQENYQRQLSCQKAYIKCVQGKRASVKRGTQEFDDALVACVLEKE